MFDTEHSQYNAFEINFEFGFLSDDGNCERNHAKRTKNTILWEQRIPHPNDGDLYKDARENQYVVRPILW
jgi:hypothetical protein